MTATPPPGQPGTPAEALRWAAGNGDRLVDPADLLRWADELDAAPAADECPACGRLHFPWCHPHGGARATAPRRPPMPSTDRWQISDDMADQIIAADRTQCDAVRRREWAAALRWEADQANESVAIWERTDLRQADSAAWCASVCYIDAHRIEVGELTPWADTPEPAAAAAVRHQDGRAGDAALAGTRRDAAADALEYLAGTYNSRDSGYDMQRRALNFAADVRAGTRTIPSQQQ